MATHLRLTAALAVLLLAGCQDEQAAQQIAQLQAENSQLQQQLSEQAGQRQAELDYLERQAGIAAGCDWLVPLCPASVTETGRRAQSENIGGGGSVVFWVIALVKLAVAGVAAGAAFGTAAWAWARHGLPTRQATEAAQQLVAEAQAHALTAQGKAAAAEAEAVAAQHQAEKFGGTLAGLEDEVTAARQVLATVQAEVETARTELAAARSAQKALSAFD